METKLGRRQKYQTPEQYTDAKIAYNKRYYEKKTVELKQKRDINKPVKRYTDEQLNIIIKNAGWERILKLLI